MADPQGMTPTDAPATMPFRPLVTFVLFGYNQEKYIREAIEGAFAQTYSPLEIVLSDDCSGDRTFAIMQEMAAAYRGPHRVSAVRTDRNLGVTPHVLQRGREASGEIVVVAAGDDISKPRRVERHVSHYRDPDVWAVTGAYDVVDEHGSLLKANQGMPELLARGRRYETYLHEKTAVIQGSTASYRAVVFALSLPDSRFLFSEDNLFTFLIPANGGRISVESSPLVLYRRHDDALANRRTRRSAIDMEERIRLSCRENENRMNVFLAIHDSCRRPDVVDRKALETELRRNRTLMEWPTASSLQRLASLAASLLEADFRRARWKLVRILGKFPNYQPRIFLVETADRLWTKSIARRRV